jgi:hypothetical protein
LKPSIGRIVTYRSSQGVDFPAIITAVPGVEGHPYPPADGCVHLKIFYCGGLAEDDRPMNGVPGPSDDRCCWRWPERVA